MVLLQSNRRPFFSSKANGLNLLHANWPSEYEPEEICELGEWFMFQSQGYDVSALRPQRRVL